MMLKTTKITKTMALSMPAQTGHRAADYPLR
jgi:hypothetical protein